MRARRTGQGVDFLAEDALERAVYVISVAAELAGMHSQTLPEPRFQMAAWVWAITDFLETPTTTATAS